MKTLIIGKQTEPCKRHKPFNGGYLEHMEWMEVKTKRGAKQKQCPKCGHYYFKCEY